MNALRRIPLSEVEAKLRSYGCTPLEGLGQLNTARWWRWPWGGAPFVLPADDDGYIHQEAYDRLIIDMAKLAPPDWEFPPLDKR